MGLVELLVLLAAVSGTAWIVGTVAWLWYRTKRLEEAILHGGGDRPHLASELEDIRSQLTASGDEVERLRERLDFLERLLNRGAPEGATTGELESGRKPKQLEG
jgi:hypothetical protein